MASDKKRTQPEGADKKETPGALQPEAAEPDTRFTHTVRSEPDVFFRCGRKWTKEGTAVSRDDFTQEEWKRLLSEPMLSVSEL